jgi:hypothetical protein
MEQQNTITIKHEGVNYHLEQLLWAWKNELEVDVNLYSFTHQREMLDELKRVLKEHFGRSTWTQQEAIKELARKDSL